MMMIVDLICEFFVSTFDDFWVKRCSFKSVLFVKGQKRGVYRMGPLICQQSRQRYRQIVRTQTIKQLTIQRTLKPRRSHCAIFRR